VEFKTTTKTSQLAADALNCTVAQIGKSIVFTNGSSIVVVISGDERVDVKKLSKLIGGKVKVFLMLILGLLNVGDIILLLMAPVR